MQKTVGVKNVSLNLIHIRASRFALDLFLMTKLFELCGIHGDIAKLAYMIREVA